MYMYPTDKQRLRLLIKAQKREDQYVVLSADHLVYHSDTFSSDSVDKAMVSDPYIARIPEDSFEPALRSLQNNEYVQRIGSSPFFQVTHRGWNVLSAMRNDWIRLILTHVVFPSIVAFVTTLITLLINGLL